MRSKIIPKALVWLRLFPKTQASRDFLRRHQNPVRRQMASDEEVLSLPLRKLMTRNPVTIVQDALAVEALKVFDERDIDDLIAVNARLEPVGMVDSQDLPELKLM